MAPCRHSMLMEVQSSTFPPPGLPSAVALKNSAAGLMADAATPSDNRFLKNELVLKSIPMSTLFSLDAFVDTVLYMAQFQHYDFDHKEQLSNIARGGHQAGLNESYIDHE